MASAGLHLIDLAIAITVVIVLIARWKVHPFLALTGAALGLGLACGIKPEQTLASFEKGFGEVAAHIGIIVALGVILGAILVSSGAANRMATSLTRLGGPTWMPWTVCAAALIIGLPLFFEVSLVLLTPLSFALARQLRISQLRLGIPLLAGIIGAHALMPPHPAPTIAVVAFGADAGKTLLYGMLVALPALAIAGPLWAAAYFRWFRGAAVVPDDSTQGVGSLEPDRTSSAPPLWKAWVVVLLAPGLMLMRSAGQLTLAPGGTLLSGLNFLGDPIVALLAALVWAIFTLLPRNPRRGSALRGLTEGSLAGAAGIILITGAGGGLKQILIDTQIGDSIVARASQAHIAPLFLAWLVAATLRVTIGTSTVATIMTSGLLAPLVSRDPGINRELMVLATGCGSVFGSHVNDPGFWFIKQYFELSLGQTIRTWTVLTVLLSVTGLGVVLLLSHVL